MLSKDSKQIKEFKKWLVANGCEIFKPTNQFEVIRFKGNDLGVVYMNRHETITSMFGEAQIAWDLFYAKKPYAVTQRVNRVKKSRVVETLLERDGTDCFYCGNEMLDGEETVEHLFSINQGGKNHIANLALAHQPCNKKADHKSVVEKVKLRDQLRRA